MRISDWSSDVCSSYLVLDSSISRKPGFFNNLLFKARMMVRLGRFWRHDLAPAIEARRKEPRDDVITYMVKIGRTSCRERVCQYGKVTVAARSIKKKSKHSKNTKLTKTDQEKRR